MDWTYLCYAFHLGIELLVLRHRSEVAAESRHLVPFTALGGVNQVGAALDFSDPLFVLVDVFADLRTGCISVQFSTRVDAQHFKRHLMLTFA